MPRKTPQKPKEEMTFEQVASRYLKGDPKKLAEVIAADILALRDSVDKRLENARREIENGARPKQGRFRL
jgi:hypothetical protein